MNVAKGNLVKRIGFIGLGIMGLPMARRLVAAGYDVIGYNRSPARAELFVAAGGASVNSIGAAVEGADIVITMLPDSPDVESVIFGAGGVLEHASPGSVIIDMSTIRPEVSRRVAKQAREREIAVLDAPVSGGEQGAIRGELSIMVGGEQAVYDDVLPVLRAMGTTVTLVGGPGSGQTVKAVNQLIVAVTLGAVAEGLTLAEASNIDTAAAIRVLSGGLAGSKVLEQKASMMCESRFDPGFRVALHHKDMGIALAVAREAGIVTPLGSMVAQEIASLVAQGYGDSDHSSLKHYVDQLSGRT